MIRQTENKKSKQKHTHRRTQTETGQAARTPRQEKVTGMGGGGGESDPCPAVRVDGARKAQGRIFSAPSVAPVRVCVCLSRPRQSSLLAGTFADVTHSAARPPRSSLVLAEADSLECRVGGEGRCAAVRGTINVCGCPHRSTAGPSCIYCLQGRGRIGGNGGEVIAVRTRGRWRRGHSNASYRTRRERQGEERKGGLTQTHTHTHIHVLTQLKWARARSRGEGGSRVKRGNKKRTRGR